MKQILLFLCCLAAVCTFSACSQEPSSISESETSQSVSSENLTTIDDISSNLDYVAITEDVGPIAATVQWTTAEEIPVTDLLGWYLRYYSATNAVKEDPLAAYRQEDTDVLLITAADFEKTAGEFFGLSVEYLQSDLIVYNAEKNGYLVSADLLKTGVSCVVRKVDIAGESVLVTFDLTSSSEGRRSYQLAINTADGLRFESCSLYIEGAGSDETPEKASGSLAEGQDNEDVTKAENADNSTAADSAAALPETK